jgi:hypothetical protein
MEDNILWQIFFDEHNNWDRFVTFYGKRIRSVVIKEVEKVLHCGDPKHGFKLFVCEGCHEIRILPYRCRSRFCTSCSCGEAEEWSRVLARDAYQVIHRHVVFTIAEELRIVFAKHRYLLKELMDEAAGLVKKFFIKKHKITPGIIAGLYTLGARAQFNPHVHMMVTMGGLKKTGEWVTKDFIPFTMLRKQWQTVVLKLLRRELSEAEKKIRLLAGFRLVAFRARERRGKHSGDPCPAWVPQPPFPSIYPCYGPSVQNEIRAKNNTTTKLSEIYLFAV